MIEPFPFQTRFHQVLLLGVKAENPVELLEGIRAVPAASIYYHTHRFLQQHHFLSPEPPNDFAYWLTNILNLDSLGEAFAAVDTVSYNNVEELRQEYIRILEEFLAGGNIFADAPEGHEFPFMSVRIFSLPTPYVAHDIKEFVEILGRISVNSLYLHAFESRMRLKNGENDFSAWFKRIGEDKIAAGLSNLDPYTMTLETLRKKIILTVEKYAGHS